MGCFCEPTFVLKRELYADSSVNFNVPYYCFPKFANDNFVDKQKDIDVCCIMSITSDIRQRLITYLNTIKKANWFIQQTEYENKLPKEQYFDILNRSKIGISIYGGGFDTIRFWEILSCKSALLSPYIPFLTVKIPDHCITYYNENFVDLKEKIDSLLQNDLWKTIAENGYNYFIKNHTVSVRMNFLLNKLKERKIIL
jgi:spore maturation protein CgeB